MEAPVVFVVPPHPALMCPIHLGILADPMIAPCGCTFCGRCIERELIFVNTCPVDRSHKGILTPSMLQPNKEIAERVNELLIHCRYGIRNDPQEGWVPNSSSEGCKMWINLGNRAAHESTCLHKTFEEEDFCIIDEDELLEFQPDSDEFESVSTPGTPDVPHVTAPATSVCSRVCPNKSNGCGFASSVEEIMRTHIISCDRAYMQKQINELIAQLNAKEEMISSLQAQLAEAQAQAHNQAMQNSRSDLVEQDIIDNKGINNSGDKRVIVSLSKGLNKLEEESQRALLEAAASLKRTKAAIKSSVVFKQSAIALSNIKNAIEEAHEELLFKFKNFLKSLDRPPMPIQAAPIAQEDEDVTLREAIQASEATFKEENELYASEDEQLKRALHLSNLPQDN